MCRFSALSTVEVKKALETVAALGLYPIYLEPKGDGDLSHALSKSDDKDDSLLGQYSFSRL